MTHPKHASPAHDILDVIRRRWSPRAFDSDRDVADADLRVLFEASRWAPSSFNEQPWRFVVARRMHAPESFAAMLEVLSASNQQWAASAPVLTLVVASTQITRTGQRNLSAWYDTGQAVALLSLQATAIGVGVRQMEGFDRAAARDRFGVPADYEPVIAMAIGYAGDPDRLSTERHRLAERAPRERQAHDAFVFDGEWGKPF
jgi:nitroreductase